MSRILDLSPNSWTSLYVPFIPKDLELDGVQMISEEPMKKYFENQLQLGKVSRVDFITKESKHDPSALSAFIHFEHWYETGESLRKILDNVGEYKLIGYYDGHYGHDFKSSKNHHMKRFMNVKINKTPIQEIVEVPKNMHQLVNNYALMETLIEEQKQKIEELEKELEKYRPTQVVNIDTPVSLGKNIFMRESSLMY
jgi:hypothetical protein